MCAERPEVRESQTRNWTKPKAKGRDFWCWPKGTRPLGREWAHWPTLKGCKWGYLVFHRKRLEPRVLPWQQLSRSHSVSFVMCIAGAKFEEHCLNISRVILNWMLCCFRGTTYDVITFIICIIQKRKKKRKKICQKGKRYSSHSEKPFKQAAIVCLDKRRTSHKLNRLGRLK